MKIKKLVKALELTEEEDLIEALDAIFSYYIDNKNNPKFTQIKDKNKDAFIKKISSKNYVIEKGSKLAKESPSLEKSYYGKVKQNLVKKGYIRDDVVLLDIENISGSTAHSLINGYPTSGKSGDKSWGIE